MYARVAVASTALDLGNLPAPVANALHGTLVENLLAHGRLVFASQAEASEFVRAIKNTPGMPPAARTKWTNLLVHLRQSGRLGFVQPPDDTTLAQVDALDRLRSKWGTQTDVAVVANQAGALLGVPEDTGFLTSPGLSPDVAVAPSAPRTPALARLNDLQQHPVAAYRSDREAFWANVLEPIATNAIAATVLDGYLFSRLSGITSGRYRASRDPEQVTWLLQHLDNVMAPGATVQLIGNASHVESGETAQSIAQTVHDQWSPLKTGRLAKVQVLLGQPAHGRRFPHKRYIRFSTGSAIMLEAGFDRLREPRIWDASGMWWSYYWQPASLDALRADERSAEALARHPATFALSR